MKRRSEAKRQRPKKDVDPVLAEARAWLKKLNNPKGATYKIAHARHP